MNSSDCSGEHSQRILNRVTGFTKTRDSEEASGPLSSFPLKSLGRCGTEGLSLGASPYPNPVLCSTCQEYTPALQLFCAVLHRLVGLKPEPVSLDAIAAGKAIGQRASMLTKVETQRLVPISRDCHRSIGSVRMATNEPTRQGTEALSCWSLGLHQMHVHSSAHKLRTQNLEGASPPHTGYIHKAPRAIFLCEVFFWGSPLLPRPALIFMHKQRLGCPGIQREVLGW